MNQIRSTRSAILLLVPLLLAQGCRESSTEPTDNLVVQTAQTAYDVPPVPATVTISATLANTSDRTLLLDGIGRDFAQLEKLVDGQWQIAYVPVYTMQAATPIRLEPGHTRNLTFSVFITRAPNTSPAFQFDIDGTYRAAFGIRVAGEKGLTVYSNEFELRLAQ